MVCILQKILEHAWKVAGGLLPPVDQALSPPFLPPAPFMARPPALAETTGLWMAYLLNYTEL